ncbi:toxin-antitoxin system YwqK family antitoxin [Urechidicola vernalis]|uniref:Toxin-antitoxin system YwqK family antitoxin n=1 Tax=Urechidicola vernalis TaxID=3075600 RepID=A0ABU2Y0L2_9FLAO|nr:toxin-antitoxin system YwqK family antitoxin [Urechidicola sp. P050]MDT0551704.1 toxin-antitoxin system YwqK family antitoxin [Urechidicola sp. P050]
MKKITLLILILQLGLYSIYGQDINQVNSDGERHGLWKKYYPNKRIRYEGTFENGKEVGVFKFYSMNSSDNPMVIRTFAVDSGESLVQFFTAKGVLESEGKIIDKQRIGKWLYFHKDGKTVMIEENYENGKLSGEYKLFYENKKLTKLTHYQNGREHGNCKQYSDSGILIEDVNYVQGQLHGPAIYYETSGQLKQKGSYEEDLRVGVWEIYKDGQLFSSKVVPTVKD